MRPCSLVREFRYAVAPEYAPWMANAACKDMDPDLFFPERPTGSHAYDRARAICASCPVLEECRAWGDRVEGAVPPSWWYGMLAGETPHARRARRHRPKQPKYRKPTCRHGHLYNEENTLFQKLPNGKIHRKCRACNRARVSRGEASRAVRFGEGRAALELSRRSA